MKFIKAMDGLVHIMQCPEPGDGSLGTTWCVRMYAAGKLDNRRIHQAFLAKFTEVPANCIECISLYGSSEEGCL